MSNDQPQPPTPRGYKTPNKQGRIHRDPTKIEPKRIKPLELILQGPQALVELDRHRFLTNQQVGELLFRHTLTQKGKPRSEKQYQETCNRDCLELLLNTNLIERM